MRILGQKAGFKACKNQLLDSLVKNPTVFSVTTIPADVPVRTVLAHAVG